MKEEIMDQVDRLNHIHDEIEGLGNVMYMYSQHIEDILIGGKEFLFLESSINRMASELKSISDEIMCIVSALEIRDDEATDDEEVLRN